MEAIDFFPEIRTNDLAMTFGRSQPGELPLKRAAIKTETGYEELEASMAELGAGVLLAVQALRCGEEEEFLRPLDQRREELEGYRNRSCIFRRNGDSNSNLYAVTASGDGRIWVRNEGDRSLRFLMPDGSIYRVCTGYTEVLAPSNRQAQTGPTQILLDLGGNALDLQVSAVHVKYGEAPWVQGGIDCMTGPYVDSYICRIFCGDDCLGVLEPHSSYFLRQPKLVLLDTETYGPSRWLVRNSGKEPLPLVWPGGRTADVPPDGQVYRLEALASGREEAAS